MPLISTRTNRPYKFRLVRSYFLYFKSELAVNYECIRSHSQILNRAENHSDFRISLRFPSDWSKIGVLADFCTISQDGFKIVRSFSVFGLQVVSITQATCTADGLKKFNCHCGDTYTETIFATGHSHTGRITTKPTCSSTGVKTFTCNCGDSYTETISKIAHSFGEWEYDSGNTYKRECTKCDEGIESKSIYLTLNKSSHKCNLSQR